MAITPFDFKSSISFGRIHTVGPQCSHLSDHRPFDLRFSCSHLTGLAILSDQHQGEPIHELLSYLLPAGH